MAKTNPSTILLKGNPQYREANADAAITPGHLCEFTATGVKVHAAAGGNALPLVAKEAGQIGDTISTAYAEDDRVYLMVCAPGDLVYMLLANGENASVNSALVSDGLGALDVQANTTAVDQIVGYAEEALNNATGAAARIKVRIR